MIDFRVYFAIIFVKSIRLWDKSSGWSLISFEYGCRRGIELLEYVAPENHLCIPVMPPNNHGQTVRKDGALRYRSVKHMRSFPVYVYRIECTGDVSKSMTSFVSFQEVDSALFRRQHIFNYSIFKLNNVDIGDSTL